MKRRDEKEILEMGLTTILVIVIVVLTREVVNLKNKLVKGVMRCHYIII